MNETAMVNPSQDATRREEFAVIAKRHAPSLLRTARRLCGNDRDTAEDIVQDSLVAAYRAFLDGRFDGRHPGAWLTRILTNSFLYSRRQARSAPGLDCDLLTNDDTSTGTWTGKTLSPEQNLLQGALSEPLENALRSLPESQRLCVVLIDIEELPYAEVAQMLGVPIGTVRSRLARARMQMLEMLRDAQGMEYLS